MRGRAVLVTGGNSGLGFAAASALAAAGATVHLVCRNAQRGSAARDSIISSSSNDEYVPPCSVVVAVAALRFSPPSTPQCPPPCR
jgi:NAD(P)-dependent dehydrogenase (short-subunit alcohol dehydrogenase family)